MGNMKLSNASVTVSTGNSIQGKFKLWNVLLWNHFVAQGVFLLRMLRHRATMGVVDWAFHDLISLGVAMI